tara:strand:- start:5819 stop:6670 length:852 start_codon:yes stop_codon:yes gene_type:complete
MVEKTGFILSAFGDEIDDDVDKQFQVLNSLDIGYLDLRKAWGINVADLSDMQVNNLKLACERYLIKVSCIGSPVGKSLITDDFKSTMDTFERILSIACSLETDKVRIFSFYPPKYEHQEAYIKESVTRLKYMSEIAHNYGITLLMENEKGLMGDTPERCSAILNGVDSENLKFVWDTGNFPHSGVGNSVDRGWPILGEYVSCVQVKDARLSDRKITVAGDGDGQVFELLECLRDSGYYGFLALEPHLKLAGNKGGFSGPNGMSEAAIALRQLIDKSGCDEIKT